MHWLSYLPRLRYAYMQEIHSSTRIAPFELLYGFVPRHPLPVHIGHINMQSPYVNDASYLDLITARELVDVDLCQHVEKLRDKYMTFDAQVFDSINEMQDRQIQRFQHRQAKAKRALPVFDVGDYVFEMKESPRPMQAIADGHFLVVARKGDEATLRTGTTKWDPVPKEFTRKVDLLAPCLTRRQAVAKAHGQHIISALREAPIQLPTFGAILQTSFVGVAAFP